MHYSSLHEKLSIAYPPLMGIVLRKAEVAIPYRWGVNYLGKSLADSKRLAIFSASFATTVG